jgi:hypothetical protein
VAEEVLDALVVSTRFDDSGLTEADRAVLNAARQFVTEINRLSTEIRPLDIDTQQLRRNLLGAGDDVASFFAGVQNVAGEGLDRFGEAIGATTEQINRMRDDLRSGIIEELQRFGFTAEEARRAAGGLAALPVPRIDTTRLLTSGQQLISSLVPTLQAWDAARARLSQPIDVAGVGGTAGLLPLVRQLNLLPPAQQAVVAGSQGVSLALRNERGEVVGLVQDVRRLNDSYRNTVNAQAQVAGSQQAVQNGFRLSTQGITRLASGLTGLAVLATGIPGPFATVVSALLLLGAGSPAVAGVAAGVAVVGFALRLLTADTVRAREATDDFIQSQLRLARAQDPAGELQRQFSGVAGEIEGVTRRMERLNEQLAEARSGRTVTTEAGDALIVVDPAEIARIEQQMAEVGNAVVTAARAFRDQVLSEVDAITRARLNAERQASEDVLSLQRQTFQTQESQLRSQLALELITREQFFAERRALTQRAGEADIAALQRQRQLAAEEPARDEAAQRTRDAQVAHLDRQIQLRRVGLTQQLQEIQNEQLILEFQERKVRLLEQQRIRIEQAGGGNLVQGAGGLPIPEPIEIPLILQGAAAREQLDTVANRARRAQQESEALAGTIFEVTRGLDSVRRGASAFGDIGQEAEAAIGSVLDLADAIGQVIAQGASVGGVLGIVGAGVGLLGGLLGESALQRERNDLTRRNIEALERNTRGLLAQDFGREDIAGVEALVRRLTADADLLETLELLNPRGLSQGGIPGEDRRIIGELARELGTTLDNLLIVAEQQGITLFDSKGNLVPGAFDALAEAFRRGLITVDDFTSALDAATEAAIGIPGGFRQARLAFEAQIPGFGPNAPPQTGAIPPPSEPTPPTAPDGRGGRDRTKGPSVRAEAMTINGEVHVHLHLPPGWQGDGVSLAHATREALQRESAATTGRTDDWSGVP